MKNSLLKNIFYDLIPGKQRVRLNFKIDKIQLNNEKRIGKFRLTLDDPRWYEKKIDGELYYVDSIDGNMISADTLVESFQKGKDIIYGGKGIPMYVDDFMSENKGAKTVVGLRKLIELGKNEEAFLSCNSIFLRRLRVILYSMEAENFSFDGWQNWNNSKFRSSGIVIHELSKLGILNKENKTLFLEYSKDRNRIDHQISEGSIESRDIVHNLVEGISLLDRLEKLFCEINKLNLSKEKIANR